MAEVTMARRPAYSAVMAGGQPTLSFGAHTSAHIVVATCEGTLNVLCIAQYMHTKTYMLASIYQCLHLTETLLNRR